jgi:hypothetical protein
MQYFIKVFIVLVLIVAITELSKKSQIAGAILASLPITSLIAILWLKFEGSEHQVIIGLCQDIFWMVIPSLVFFLVFPLLLKKNIHFALSFIISVFLTSSTYLIMLKGINYFRKLK